MSLSFYLEDCWISLDELIHSKPLRSAMIDISCTHSALQH